MSLTSSGFLCAVPPYVGHMRPSDDPAGDTWGSQIRFHRTRLQLTQDDLAKQLGVALKTVSRWENRNARPESYDTAVAAIYLLGMDRESGLRLAGFGPERADQPEADPYAFVREMGLDPANRVVRRILHMPGISDSFRESLLRREKVNQDRDEQRRLDDLDWQIQQQRSDDEGRAAG